MKKQIYIKDIPTNAQLRNAQNTIGVDEGSILLRLTSKLEHQSAKKLEKTKLARVAIGRKHIKFNHLLTWDQKYKKLPI